MFPSIISTKNESTVDCVDEHNMSVDCDEFEMDLDLDWYDGLNGSQENEKNLLDPLTGTVFALEDVSFNNFNEKNKTIKKPFHSDQTIRNSNLEVVQIGFSPDCETERRPNVHVVHNENVNLVLPTDGPQLMLDAEISPINPLYVAERIEEMQWSNDEFDAIIEYDPLSDEEEVLEEVVHQKNKKPYTIIANDDGLVEENAYIELQHVIGKPKKLAHSRTVKSDLVLQPQKTVSEDKTKSGPGVVSSPKKLAIRTGASDKFKMTIQTSDQGPKKNCCPYCNKLQSKFARHIVDMHSDKPEVLELSKLSKGSKERKRRIDAIKKIGNFEHNSNPELNKNLIIPSRRSNAKHNRNASDIDVCYECSGTYFKKSIAKHICSRKVIKGDRSSAQLNRLVAGRIHERASASLHDITSVMLDDDTANTAKYDWLLVVYGNELCEQFGYEPHHKIVRDRLRMLSRLLVQLKRIEPDITDFASLYHPKYCDVVVEAIREDSGFRLSDRQFQKPWNATKSVTEVKRVGRVLSEECISKKNKELKEQTNDFLALFQSRAAIRVNKLARTTIITRNRNKEEDLPTDDDIQHFQRFLDKKRKQYFDDLKDEYTFAKWINLSEVTMVSLILFNRRRVGELENSLTSEYNKRRRVTNKNDQLFRALTAEGKERVERYSRMNVRGKRDNRAPIMLHPELEKCVDIILYYRDKAGVPKENDLLFGLPATNNRKKRHLMGSSTVAKLSVQCEADNPKTLRGTKFRKHFATFCATKELNDNILTDVAKQLGHSLLIHKDIYRGNDLNREVARMSALLEEASGHNEMHSQNIVNSTQVDNEFTVDHAEINSGGSTCPDDLDKIAQNADNNATPIQKSQREQSKVKPGKISRKRGTADEKSLIAKIFKDHIKNGTVPKKDEIEAHQAVNHILKNRSYQTIRKWVTESKI